MELWAAIDLMGGSVVTLAQGMPGARTVWKSSPAEVAERWQGEGAHGLHIVDLDAAFGKGSNDETIMGIIRKSGVPVQVGGGVRSAEAASRWFSAGAERVVIGTMAFRDPAALVRILTEAGAERVVVAADYRDGVVVGRGWTESQGIGVLEAVRELEGRGVENVLVTSVRSDGMGEGPDVQTLRKVCGATGMSVLASGGIRDVADLLELKVAGAHGAILGRALYDGTLKIGEAGGRL